MTLSPLGDAAVVISLGERVDEAVARRVRALGREIQRNRIAGVTDVVGAFASVAVFYDPLRAGGFAGLRAELEKAAERASAAAELEEEGRRIELPVCYGGEHGPDLGVVAEHAGLSPEAVVAAHGGAEYLVHAIGFVPGFPYLGGLPAALATPRRATPRPRVPAGAVGIGGAQTGVYPQETPGGWNLIGRTPVRLFEVERAEAALLRAGDRVVFRPISAEEFAAFEVAPACSRHAGEGRQEAGAATIEVTHGGMFTTVQDGGRTGHRAAGVPSSGAADPVALRVANLLVGNRETAAALEFTLLGPELMFTRETVIALAGADFGLPRGRPLRVAAGERVKLGAARAGCRGYLAVAGGIAVAEVMGSRSTYLRGGFGGLGGRALREGDGLHVEAGSEAPRVSGNWRIDERVLPAYGAAPIVRVVRGAHADEFPADWMREAFEVTTQSDRMGVRLRGPALKSTRAAELVSSPVAPGTIQVPPDGQPIVLLADAQTVGGYPQIAHVITVDLPLVAQLRPGERVRFVTVSLDEAHALLGARERALGMLREGLAQKLA